MNKRKGWIVLALLSLALLVVPVAVPDTVFAAQNSGTETKALSLARQTDSQT